MFQVGCEGRIPFPERWAKVHMFGTKLLLLRKL